MNEEEKKEQPDKKEGEATQSASAPSDKPAPSEPASKPAPSGSGEEAGRVASEGLKKLRGGLYGQVIKEERTPSEVFRKQEHDVEKTWKQEPRTVAEVVIKTKMSLLKKILLGSILFFLIAIGIATYNFYNGGNIISKDAVILKLSAPVAVDGGELFEFEISITNGNDVAIETADLEILYPLGTYVSVESQEVVLRDRERLGTIAPHETIRKKVEVLLFGEQNSEKRIIATLEFRFAGTSALLEKTEDIVLSIASSPLNFSVELEKEVSEGQEFDFVVNIESNSNDILQGLLVSIEYPFGFEAISTTPNPISGSGIWNIGDLPPAGKQTITVRGTLNGEKGDQKVFHISVGMKDSKRNEVIGTIYSLLTPSVSLTSPFISLAMLFEGRPASNYTIGSKETVRADVVWESTIPTRIVDGEISVTLSGNAFDRFSVIAGSGGFYRSIDDTIIWDKSSSPKLSVIEPGTRDNVKFSFTPLPLVDDEGNVIKQPEVIIEVRAKGKRISEISTAEPTVVTRIERVKIDSNLLLTPRVVYYAGPFTNTGSLPPKVEKETTYTVIWTVTNSSNRVSEASVRATLPSYVRWMGNVSSTEEDITFNEIGGEVIWNLKDVSPATGYSIQAREVAFQIAFLPSLSQIGKSPVIIGGTLLSGDDQFTGTNLRDIKGTLTTQLSTDPGFTKLQGLVSF